MCDNVRSMESRAKTKMKERGRRFPCSECGKVLTQRSSLRIHVMVRHTEKKPPNIPKLSCLECDKMLKVADSEESTESSADEEESDPDECLATNLDKSENRFRGSARLLAAALRQHSERV